MKLSRYPYFWWAVGGFYFLGVMSAGMHHEVNVLMTVLLMFWFIFPGAIFFNALNDAYDYESDRLNPRKQELEMASPTEGRSRLLWVSFWCLCTSIFLYPYVSSLFVALFLLWVVGIVIYNVEPLRFKAVPVVNVIFGGVWHYVFLSLLGYVFVAGELPPHQLTVIATLFMTGMHIISGDAVDIEYDRAAGIKTLGVWIGSTRATLLLGAFVLFSMAVYGWVLGYTYGAILTLVFPLYVLYEIWRDDVANRKVVIYKNLSNFSIFYWFCIGSMYIVI